MAVMSRKPVVSLRPDSAKVYRFQQPGESAIAAQRLKKRLDCYQIDEVRLLLNGLFQAAECEIVVSDADRRESFCQRCDVLSPCQPVKLLDTLPGSRLAAFTGMGGGHQANIQRNRRRGEALYDAVVIFLLEVQESVVKSRFRIVAIQVERFFKMLRGRSIVALHIVKIGHPRAAAGGNWI